MNNQFDFHAYNNNDLTFLEAKENPKIFENLKKSFEHMVPLELNLERGSEKRKKLGEEIRKFYFQDREPSVENIRDYVMVGGLLFVHILIR